VGHSNDPHDTQAMFGPFTDDDNLVSSASILCSEETTLATKYTVLNFTRSLSADILNVICVNLAF